MGAGAQRELALHILAVPFQQEGHLNGMLRLAQTLVTVQEGVVVTFAYPSRFHRLALKRNKLLSLNKTHSHSLLRIHVVDDGLPTEEEVSLTPPVMSASMPIFQHNIKQLLDHLLLNTSKQESQAERKSPCTAATPHDDEGPPLPPLNCIISDTFLPWTQELADAADLPRVDFWTGTATLYSMGTQFSLLVSKGIVPLSKSCWANVEQLWKADAPLIDVVPGLPPFPPTDLPPSMIHPDDERRRQSLLASFSQARKAHTILVHSVYELESVVFDALQALGFPVYSVGPLLTQDIAPTPPSAQHECMLWLDSQTPSSVIYIALGTIAKLSPAETLALALGLEASKRPFLWVIRPDSISISDALPDGFLQRTVDRGSGLIIPWAPQTEVLRHPSIGAFFSHCGWNSTMECMWEGVPMVACPRMADQRSNARWIVEHWKTGVELERRDDGSFSKEAVQNALHEVLNANIYKERSIHAKGVARSAVENNGTSHSNLISFLQRLRRNI